MKVPFHPPAITDRPFAPPPDWSIDANLSPQEIAAHAYVGGILDGEGYIGACRRLPTKSKKLNGTVSPIYSIRVSVAMVDEAPVRFLAGFCGVPQKVYLRGGRKHGHQSIFVIDLEADQAAKLLTMVIPFLLGKRRQAELALKLYELRRLGKLHRTKLVQTLRFKGGRAKGHLYRVYALNDDYLKQCDQLYLGMRRRPISNSGVRSDAYFGD